MATAGLCRHHWISSATFHKCKSKYGELKVFDARLVRQLKQENEQLKKLLPDSMLDNALLKKINAENSSARSQTARGSSSPGGARQVLKRDDPHQSRSSQLVIDWRGIFCFAKDSHA